MRDCPETCYQGKQPGKPRDYVEAHLWARHFLGAMSRVIGPDEFDGVPWGEGSDRRRLGREAADGRDALTIFVDRLQTGDGGGWLDEDDALALGEGLALWLRQAPCLACGPARARHPGRTHVCPVCRNSGRALDAHIQAIEGVTQRLAQKFERK